jgi:HAD superfamily hydrolase (TIGR01450 family)
MSARFDLDQYDAFIVDVDGVLTRGPQVIPGAEAGWAALQTHAEVVLLTNNSTRSRKGLADHLLHLGIPVKADRVFASSRLAAEYLIGLGGPVSAWIVGEAGLREEFSTAGHHLAQKPEDAQWLIAGMDRKLDYSKLHDALRALLAGAKLLATNEDATYPTPSGLVPGAGAIVGALRGMGFTPETTIGKPSPHAFRLVMESLGLAPERVLVVGDRLDTDIAGAHAAGLDSVLVLTGVSRLEEVVHADARPRWISDSLEQVSCGEARSA